MMKKYIIYFFSGIIIMGITGFSSGLGEKTAELISAKFIVNNVNKSISSTYIIDDKMYVPLREFCDQLGYNIRWSDGNNVNIITKIDDNAGSDWSVFEEDGLFGYKNAEGKVVIEPKFKEEPGRFHDGMALIKEKNIYGYINTKGIAVIPLQFYIATDFHNGVAGVRDYIYREDGAVSTSSMQYWIDKAGNEVFEVEFLSGSPFYEGYSAVEKGKLHISPNKWSYIDMSGALATDKEFDRCREFKNGYAEVQLNEKWGMIDKQFELIIDCKYDSREELEESTEYKQLYNGIEQ